MKRVVWLLVALAAIVYGGQSRLCYEESSENGLFCSGVMSIMCTTKVRIKNISSDSLENVKIYLDSGAFSGKVFSECGIDSKEGGCKKTSAFTMGPFNILDNSIEYDVGEFSPQALHEIYASAMFSVAFFNGNNLYAQYDLNGETYVEKIPKCKDTDEKENLLCGVFTNVLQTRKDGSEIANGENNGAALGEILNPPSCTMHTKDVYVALNPNGSMYGGLKCNDSYAVGKLPYANPINVNYNFSIKTPQVKERVTTQTLQKVINQTRAYLPDNVFDLIKLGYINQSEIIISAGGSLKANQILNIRGSVKIENDLNANVEIGDLVTSSYNEASVSFANPLNELKIYKIESLGSNKFTFNAQANSSIQINELDLNSAADDNIVLKAPKVIIGKLNATNDNVNLTIYADEIDIGDISLAQHNNITIYPYTPNGKVEFYSNSITASSSSTMLLSSGEYYVNSFSIPGTSGTMSSVRALDANQVIDFYINGDFKPNNNPGINNVGNGGRNGCIFNDDLPAANFRLYVNGDFDFGGGGTSVNAMVYVEGKTTIGANSCVKGAINSYDTITFANGAVFKWDESIANTPYAQICPDWDKKEQSGSFNVVNDTYTDALDTIPRDKSGVNTLFTQIAGKNTNYYVVHTEDDNVTLSKFKGAVKIDLVDNSSAQECSQKTTLDEIYRVFDDEKSVAFALNYLMAKRDVAFRIEYSDYEMPQSCIELLRGAGHRYRHGHQYGHTYRRGNNQDQMTSCIEDIMNQCKDNEKCEDVPKCIAECELENNPARGHGENANTTSGNGNTYRHRYRHRHGRGLQCVIECLFEDSKSVCSRDNFAIRPYKLVLEKANGTYLSGRETDFVVKVYNYNNQLMSNFNDFLDLKFSAKDAKGCYSGEFKPAETNIQFTNGVLHIPGSYSDIGDINLTVSENKSNPYARVDYNDEDETALLVKEANATVSTFIPGSFAISGVDFSGKNGDYTYLSRDLPMFATLSFDLKVLNAASTPKEVKNFTKNCYAKDVSFLVKLGNLPDVKMKPLFSLDNEHVIESGSFDSISGVLGKDKFTNSLNHFEIAINLKKDYSKPVNPFDLKIVSIDLSDADIVTSNIPVDKTSTFKYARIVIPDVAGYLNRLHAPAKVEIYDNGKWILNESHTAAMGDVKRAKANRVDVKLNAAFNHGAKDIEYDLLANTLPYSEKIEYDISSWLWYHPGADDYKDFENGGECKNHPCNKVTFMAISSGWSGIGDNNSNFAPDKNRTVKFSPTPSASKSSVKRLNW